MRPYHDVALHRRPDTSAKTTLGKAFPYFIYITDFKSLFSPSE